MKISKYIFFYLFLCFSICLSAQSPELLHAEGEIPKEFITSSAIKYKKQVEKLESNKIKRKEKKNKSQFLLETNFMVDDILQSGMVLFNDPATVYVNKVLSNLPIEDSKLERKKPRAYVLNSGAVNAFATHQGIIFVTLGLLANIQNEAQLAFILSHELMHIKHQHAINKFIDLKDIDRDERRKGRNVDEIAVDRALFKKSMYSRKLEEEADETGLDLFLKSQYDPNVILNIFQILHYSYLPFEDYTFDKSFFEDENFIIPEDLWLSEVNKISPMEDDEDAEKKSSHPSSVSRLQNIQSRIDTSQINGKKAFIYPKEEFFSIQEKARYQIPYLNLYDEIFPEAIYTSYLMMKEYPDDIELKKVIGKSLYMQAKYENYVRKEGGSWNRELAKIADNTEGSVHQVYNLLSEMDNKEVTILALKYNWNIYQLDKEDEEMQQIIDDLFVQFADLYDDLNDFKTEPRPKIEVSDILSNEAEKKDTLSKNEKIEKTNTEAKFWQYAFVNELANEDFKKAYKKGQEDFKDLEDRDDYYESPEGRKELASRRKKEKKKGKQLGIQKIVLVNPFYLSLDERKGGEVQYIRSEEKQAYFRQSIKDIAKISKIDATLLDVTDLSTNDIEKFNDIAEINQYFNQQMDIYSLSLTPGYNQNKVNAIADKYGTDYFLWTGVVSLHEKNNGWAVAAVTLIMPPLLPFAIANAATPKYDMLYYAILFDVKTGRRSFIKMDYFDKRDNNTIVSSHIYDVFHQIKSTSKK